MRLKLYFFQLFFPLFVWSCQSKESPVNQLSLHLPYQYKLTKTVDEPAEVPMAVALLALPKQELQVRITLQNTGRDSLWINLPEANLLNKKGWRASPLLEGRARQLLLAGQADTLLLNYQPVSQGRLFRQAGIRGPLEQQYRLPLSFLQSAIGEPVSKDTLTFTMPGNLFRSYLQETGFASPMLLYAMEAGEKQKERLNNRLKSLFAGSNQSGYGRIMEGEVFMAGINTRLAVFGKGDSLFLNLRIINHSPKPLELIPAFFRLSADEGSLKEGDDEQHQAEFILRKGDRFEVRKRFKKPAETDSLWLSLKGIRLEETKEVLMEDSILLRPLVVQK